MSAARLREAAALLRDKGEALTIVALPAPIILALADHLDNEAVGIESGNWRPTVATALAVVDAVLGDPA